jgi:hypothetical protein
MAIGPEAAVWIGPPNDSELALTGRLIRQASRQNPT